jgi:hypothetical protein
MTHARNTFFQHVSDCEPCKLFVMAYNRPNSMCIPGWSLYQNALDLTDSTNQAWMDNIRHFYEDYLLGRDMDFGEAVFTLEVMCHDLKAQAYNVAFNLKAEHAPEWQGLMAVIDSAQEKLKAIGEKFPKHTEAI